MIKRQSDRVALSKLPKYFAQIFKESQYMEKQNLSNLLESVVYFLVVRVICNTWVLSHQRRLALDLMKTPTVRSFSNFLLLAR